MADIRYQALGFLQKRIVPGQIYPWWFVTARLVLLPVSTIGVLLYRASHPFDPFTMTWTIHGTQFTDELLMVLAGRMGDDWHRFVRQPNGTVTVERRIADELEGADA